MPRKLSFEYDLKFLNNQICNSITYKTGVILILRYIVLINLCLFSSIFASDLKIITRQYKGLFVTDNSVSAPLPISLVDSLISTEKKANGINIRFTKFSRFTPDSVHTRFFTFDQLQSRINNVYGLKAHYAKNYTKAIEYFKKAVLLDPELTVARTNLACAQTKSGSIEDAVISLQPLLELAPIATLMKIHTDADLQPLLENNTIKKHFAKSKGDVTYKLNNTHTGYSKESTILTYSDNLKLFAVLEQQTNAFQSSWLGRITFFDATGTEVFREIIIENSETDPDDSGGNVYKPAIVNKRLTNYASFLSKLGFRKSQKRFKGVPMFEVQSGHAGYPLQQFQYGGKEESKYPVAYSAFWKDKGEWIHLFQGDYTTRLDTLHAGDYFDPQIMYYEDFNVVLFFWVNDIACGGGDFRDDCGVTLIPIPVQE